VRASSEDVPADARVRVESTAGQSDAVSPPTDGFVPLFNGKDLTGWRRVTGNGDSWRVQDGLLAGHGGGTGKPTSLTTQRSDFANYHLRLRLMHADGNPTGIFVRHGAGDDRRGYHVSFGGVEGSDKKPIPVPPGSIKREEADGRMTPGRYTAKALKTGVRRNTWFDLEIIAIDNVIVVKISQQEVSTYDDQKGPFRSGRITLFCRGDVAMQVKSIEIKELPSRATK
jgi:hypothetical protein